MMTKKKMELTEIYKNFFTIIDSKILASFVEIFDMKEKQLEEYRNFRDYCLETPTKLFDIIDCLYPYQNDININIHKLKLHFKDDKLVLQFLNQCSNKIIGELVKNGYLSTVIKQSLRCLLLQILKYHDIYEEKDKKLKFKYLIKKEYLYRKKNIKKNV